MELIHKAVHRSEGNLVHEVDKSNPTRILLGAIENAGIENSKDDKFYLAVLNDVDEVWVLQLDYVLLLKLLLDLSGVSYYLWRPIKRDNFARVSRSSK